MENIADIVKLQAQDALRRLGVSGTVSTERVADSVLRHAVYWQEPLPSGNQLLFLRLCSPAVQREEVFLGNVLFNAFLSKAFARAVGDSLGQAELVANDLESYYFLVRTAVGVPQLADAFRAEVERSLPDLFFGEQNEARGVYGGLSGMFTFRKSDFEPFPVYAVPQFLAPHLERAVRRELDRLLAPDIFPDRVRTALATLAFFYGRNGGDTQSFPNFVDHLVNDKDCEGLLKASQVKRAFNISSTDKPAIKQSLDDGTYSAQGLRSLLAELAQAFQNRIDNGSTKWFMGFLHKDEKFVALGPSDYLDVVLAETQVGYSPFVGMGDRNAVPCRLCTVASASVEERYVTTGLNSFRFNNQNIRKQSEKVCARCALYSYLAQKLLGTEMVLAGGKLPQVPKTYNLIFHYGKHTEEDVAKLTKQIDLVWDLVRQHRGTDQVRREAAQQVRDLQAKYEREKKAEKKSAIADELAQAQTVLEKAQAAVAEVEEDILEICPWLKETGVSPVPADNCSLDALSNIQLSETRVERHILGLGMGGYRMILFVLPQIRAPRDAKEHDFAQRRFSNSRVTVTALLSFLRELCGCDGPFYYQSLPALTPEAFRRDMFYIQNEPVSVTQAQNEYQLVTQLAWRLVWQRGSDGFVRKVVLAEKLFQAPLGTLAAVMRDSAILGQTKGNYKQLGGGYRDDWKAQDLTEYAQFIQRLSEL